MATKPAADHLKDQRACTECGAQIGFLLSPNGKRLVLDAKPLLVTLPDGTSAWAYASHWGTCPKAGEIRARMDAARRREPGQEG